MKLSDLKKLIQAMDLSGVQPGQEMQLEIMQKIGCHARKVMVY